MLAAILPANEFYAEKLKGVRLPLERIEDLAEFPTTCKNEIVPSGHDGRAANHTFPLSDYVRFHQTSGTRGRPMIVMDTADDWQWWIDCWQYVLDAAEITREDRAMLAFSFGPFIGFWSAQSALQARGSLVIPGGGMSTSARLELLETSGATAVFCTPTYALRMAEVAETEGLDLGALDVEQIIVAGEPGGSLPAVRRRIETAGGAKVTDHSGATEVGPWGFGDGEGRGLHVIESEFIAETISIEHGGPAERGESAELLLTSLGRYGCPVIRYRTGDIVRARRPENGPMRFLFLERGVVGRADDMLIIRGVNIFPTSVEQILHSFPEIAEYRMIAQKRGALDELVIEIEDRSDHPERVSRELHTRLGLHVEVQSVPLGSLPRFEGKGKRFVDRRR